MDTESVVVVKFLYIFLFKKLSTIVKFAFIPAHVRLLME